MRSSRKIAALLDEEALYLYSVKALARQMRSVTQLQRLMRTKVEPGEPGEKAILAVLARLKEHGYLDDVHFAHVYARLRQENEGYGRRRVEQALIAKGLSSELVATALDDAYGNVNEEELARRYLARKRIGKPESDKEIARVIRQLSRAGFSFPAISTILKNWEIEIWGDGAGDEILDGSA